MMASPQHYERFVRAAREGKVDLNWGQNNIRGWAKQRGWPTPLIGLKKALIRKMAESQKNYNDAMISGGIDVGGVRH